VVASLLFSSLAFIEILTLSNLEAMQPVLARMVALIVTLERGQIKKLPHPRRGFPSAGKPRGKPTTGLPGIAKTAPRLSANTSAS